MKSGIFQKTSVWVFSVILLIGAGFYPTLADAQSRAQKSIITQLLWQTLLQCYEGPSERIATNDEVRLRVELNGNGDIDDLPEMLEPSKLTPGERALLREATVALIGCTPIISGAGDKSIYGTFDMVLNREGLLLKNVDAFVGRAEVVPELDTLEFESVEEDEAAEQPTTEVLPDAEMTEATAQIEAELGLNRAERQEIQRRLTLLDYSTKGVDGVFGNGTRGAISAWQGDNAIPVSGFLDLNQIVKLREMSQEEFAAWDARPKRYTDRNGCLRESNGTIIQGRSFNCDLAAASQSLGLSR